MYNYFKKNLYEIQNDTTLKITGCFLAFAHTITAYDWITNHVEKVYSTNYIRTACYPFFQNCWKVEFFDLINFKYVLFVYLILSFLTGFFFITSKIKLAYILSIALLLIKFVMVFSRYNVMGNYHTMHFLACICYLFFSQKRVVYVYIICIFYFCAGLLKFNQEWMSGAALVGPPPYFGPFLLVASLAYVIILETALIWGLLSKYKAIRFVTLLQLFIFHLYSYFIVGYFYPSIMICLLSMIWVPYIITDNFKFNYHFFSLNKMNMFFIFALIFLNILPKIQYDDPALDGKRRFLRFNMLDARTECNQILLLKTPHTVQNLSIAKTLRALRVHCDPVSYQAYIDRICSELEKDQVLQVFMESKRTTNTKYTPIWDTKNACMD